ncbi:MAG: arylsulfatase [Candidatus Marinimicrobia bacterium]|nr:arylsulfatase [Candidatus Neomarinimicrobiota bacterium]MBT3675292.1 arylsulfatase [Candidatus Neomarinimicrobiota bacterium]MBT3762820.1 arylsulfatase [Candidatus Neomarinimicrobiota bacterium]MBT4068191.1 arylsulfatase [Candidatus Neomarinimicrobiota bacterium]MBT4270285.1 arylsulfatase [Candidatus Neomarinimicrobiota bacterium]
MIAVFGMIIISCNKSTEKYPNIVYILADDMGYGDVSALNENSKIQTKYIDQLAKEGISFTDAHSGSSVCTPTRYGILTGRYSWRSILKKGVTWSYDKHVINPDRMTVASMLKSKGYKTGAVGKWHLGLDWDKDESGIVNLKGPIKNGPNELGFEYFYGIAASLDIPPYVYIQNDYATATEIDTIEKNDGMGFWRRGPIGNDFKHEDVLPQLTKKAISFINESAPSDNPFFLYFPLPAPHTPILPSNQFVGKSGTNAYGDFVLMVDDVVGQVMDALKDNGIEDNTLIIFTSDNGCSPMANFKELDELGHNPSHVFRGHKADIFDGGHRIPFIVRWPEKINHSQQSDETICLVDFMATCASIVDYEIADNSAEDSYNIMPALMGKLTNNSIREATVHHSEHGDFSIRRDKWKLNFCPGSGGWSFPTPNMARNMDIPPIQLYDMENDPKESNNLASKNPEIVKHLTALMTKYIKDGRSTPGNAQQNEGETPFLPEGYHAFVNQ